MRHFISIREVAGAPHVFLRKGPRGVQEAHTTWLRTPLRLLLGAMIAAAGCVTTGAFQELYAQSTGPVTIPASTAAAIALGSAANYRLTHDSNWRDYEDTMIIAVVDELTKSAANSGQSLVSSDYNAVVQQLKTLLDSNPAQNPTFPDEAACLRYAIDTLVNPRSGSSVLSAPVIPLLPTVLANLENVKFTLLETHLSPSTPRNYPGELSLPSASAGAYEFVQNYVQEVSELAQTNAQLAGAVNAILSDLTGLDSTAAYSQVQSLYPNAVPGLPPANGDGSFTVDGSYLWNQYESIIGGVQSTVDGILAALPSVANGSDHISARPRAATPGSARSLSPLDAAGCTAGTVVITANQCAAAGNVAQDFWNSANSGVQGVSKIFGAINSQTAKEMSTAGAALTAAGNDVSQIFNLLGGNVSSAVGLGFWNAVTGLVGAGTQLAGLFGATSPQPDAAVLAQITRLSQQISALQADVDQQFKRVDSMLSTILATLSTDFGDLFQGLQQNQAALLDIEQQLNQLEQYALIWTQTADYEDLNGYVDACLDHRNQFPGTPDIGAIPYENCENDYYNWASNNVSDQIWAGVDTPDYSDSAIYNTFLDNSMCTGNDCSTPFSTLVNYLAQFPANNSTMGYLPALSPNRLPNPEMWKWVARAYLQLAREWPQYAVGVSSSRLANVILNGQELQSAIHNGNSMNNNPSTPNQPLFSALVSQEYNGMASALKTAVGNYESQTFIPNNTCPSGSFSNLPCIPPYVDLWSDPNASTSYVPSLVINGCGGQPTLGLDLPQGIFYGVPVALLTADSSVHNLFGSCISADYVAAPYGQKNLQMTITISYVGVAVASMTTLAGIGSQAWSVPCVCPDPYTFLYPGTFSAWDQPIPNQHDNNGNPMPPFTLKGSFEDRSRVSLSVSSWAQQLYQTLRTEETDFYSGTSQQFGCTTAAEGVGIQQAGQNLSGVKTLLTAYVNFGLPTFLDTDDVLRSMLYGASGLLDCGGTQAVYQAAAQAPTPQNPELDITTYTGPPSSKLLNEITNDLSQVSDAQTPDSSYEIDTLVRDLLAFESLEYASGLSNPGNNPTPTGALSFCDYQPLGYALIGPPGGTGSINVTVAVGGNYCTWIPRAGANWLTVTPNQGTGNGTVTYTASANPTPSPRSAIVIVGDQVLNIIQGPALEPYVSLSPPGIAFPIQPLGTTSPSQTVVLTNTGNQPLAISSATAVGANVSDFQASNNCSSASPLATGGTCSFNVTFSPTATGPRRASVSVVDSAPGSPHSVELTGVGTAVSLSPASESFTSQTVGTSSGAQTIVLTNVGSVPLNVFAVALTGANAADFSATNTCSSVAPSGTCNIAVTFTPAAAGSLTATLLVGDDGGGSPQPVPLSGIGVALDSISVDPARVAISQGSTQPLTAAGTFSDGTKRDLTAVVNWSSSATAVAEVSNVPGQKGLTTGIAAGAASITAELGSASGSASVVTLPEPRFAYVASLGRSTILGYAVNATTGELTANGEVSNAPSRPSSMAADPSGRYLYVADTASDRISAYVIDSDVGALAEVPGSPFRTGRLPSSIGVHPTGRFIYVANSGSGSVSAFSVDPATGTLTSLPGSPIEVGGAPAALAMDPSGRFALIADSERSALQVYVVEDATGELVRAGEPPVRLAKGVSTLAIDPTGRFVYVADSGLAAVSAYAINPETGLLTEVRGSPFRTRLVPASVAVDPSGRFVYVANSGAGSMSAYAIDDATGGLSTIPGSPFPAGSVPSWLTIDPSGKFLYVANHGSENISGYAINPATGELLPVRSSPFATGSSPLFVTTTRKVQ